MLEIGIDSSSRITSSSGEQKKENDADRRISWKVEVGIEVVAGASLTRHGFHRGCPLA